MPPRAAEVRRADTRPELANAINSGHRQMTGTARDLGQFLMECKAQCKAAGDKWGEWLEQNIEFSRSYAARLMRAARKPTAEGVVDALTEPFPQDGEDDEPKCELGSHLTPPQSSAPAITPKTSAPSPAPSRWTKPAAAASSSDRRPTDQEAARLLVGHVPADPDATVPGEKARGPLLVKIVSDALASARKLREDVDLYHAHHGGFPGPDDVRPIVAALEQARKECDRG